MIFCVTPPRTRIVENLDTIYARYCAKEFLHLQKIQSSIDYRYILSEVNKSFERFLLQQLNLKLPYVFYSPTLAAVYPLSWEKFQDVLYIDTGLEEFHIKAFIHLFKWKTRLKALFTKKTDMEFILDMIFKKEKRI